MNNIRQINLEKAFNSTDLKEFIYEVFPDEWSPICARIIESGAEFGETDKFAPRWSPIPFTIRKSKTGDLIETYLKSIIFRVHDCIHQLWGLPTPSIFDEDNKYMFKRMWMCAEVATLTITEFIYCEWLYNTQEKLRPLLENRNTLLFKWTTELKNKTPVQLGARLDQLLHKKIRPKWTRDNEYACIFLDDYVPMLEQDRKNIDWNWDLLVKQDDKSYLKELPNQRYSRKLDGLELTQWMVSDFYHLMETDEVIDIALSEFNKKRRTNVNLPNNWNTPNFTCSRILFEKVYICNVKTNYYALIFNKKINNLKIENNKIKTKLDGNLIFSLKIKDYNYQKVYLENKNLKIKAKKEKNNWIFSSIREKIIFPNIDFYLVIELNNTINFDIDIRFLLVPDECINSKYILL